MREPIRQQLLIARDEITDAERELCIRGKFRQRRGEGARRQLAQPPWQTEHIGYLTQCIAIVDHLERPLALRSRCVVAGQRKQQAGEAIGQILERRRTAGELADETAIFWVEGIEPQLPTQLGGFAVRRGPAVGLDGCHTLVVATLVYHPPAIPER